MILKDACRHKLEPGGSEKNGTDNRTGLEKFQIFQPESEPLEAKNYLMITSIIYVVLSSVGLWSKWL